LVRVHNGFRLHLRRTEPAPGGTGRAFALGRLGAIVAGWLCIAPFSALGAETPDPGNLDLSNPEVIALGKKRFNRACFYCHGYEGAGGKGASLQRRADLTPDAVFNTISNGRIRGSSVMPPWKNSLTAEEIWQLVAYILSLRDMPEQK
jgi:mono/diheme cytochrome c family protein